MAGNETQLEAALSVFEKAGSDEERLVALLLITRCELPTSDERLLIAHRVGFNFIHRLLHSQQSSTNDAEDGEDGEGLETPNVAVSPYQRLGLGILTLYSSVPSLVQQVAFLEQLSDIVAIVTTATNTLANTTDIATITSAVQVLTDAVSCLSAVGEQPGGAQQLLKQQCAQPVARLSQQLFATHSLASANAGGEPSAASADDNTDDTVDLSQGLTNTINDLQRLCMVVLTQLVQPQTVGGCSADVMLRVLVSLTDTLQSCPPELLFFTLDALSAAVAALAQAPNTARKRSVCAAARGWQRQAARSLTSAIQSQLGPELRGLVLRLAARLCRVLGMEWVFALDDKADNIDKPSDTNSAKADKQAASLTGHKAFQLLTQLAHVEMRVELEHDTLAVVLEKKSTLLACCYVIQSAIGHLLRLDLDKADVSSYEPVLTVAKAAVVAAATYIDQLAESRFGLVLPVGSEPPAIPEVDSTSVWELVQGCCMVIGAWMAEESSLLQAETVAVVIYLCTTLQEGCDVSMRDSALLCLRSLLTGLAGLVEHTSPRTTLLDDAHFLPALATAIKTLSCDLGAHEQETQQDLVMLGYVVENILLNTPRNELAERSFDATQQATMTAITKYLDRQRAKSDAVLPVPVMESLLIGLWLMLHKGVGWAHYGNLTDRRAALSELVTATGQFWSCLNLHEIGQSLANLQLLCSVVLELMEGRATVFELSGLEASGIKMAQQGCKDLAFVLRDQEKGALVDLLSLIKLVNEQFEA
eukprot:m.102913 g.102913  ORF g.102913 m.102913 type:complete len:759 (-) comp15203_c1_seq1:216-2492(-)